MTGQDLRSSAGMLDAPGVHSINHFALTVPDLRAAGRFYSSFGLQVREDGDRLAMLASQCAAPCGLIVEGGEKRLNHLSFGIYERDAERFRERLEQHRIKRMDPPKSFGGDGFWFRDPEGSLIEFRVAAKTSPDAKSGAEAGSTPEGVAATLKRSQVEHVRPRRLSHVLLFARDVLGQVAFYSRILGLKLSDHSGDGIAFMHAPHGSDHHVLAFGKSGGPGFHHCSWDVPSVHHIGLGAMQMANDGFTAGWGLGRHVVGSNYFHYVQDPWGSYAEYSCDIDYVPKGFDWRPQDYPPDDAFYVWGPAPPADFVVNKELSGD